MAGQQVENADYVPSVSPANQEYNDPRMGTPELMTVSPGEELRTPSSNESVRELMKKRDWLISRKQQLEVQILANNKDRNSDIDNMTEEKLQDLHKSLTDTLQEKTVMKDTRELILEGERLRRLTLSILFQDADANDKRWDLMNHLTEFTELSDKAEQGCKVFSEMKNDLDILRKQNFELKKRSRMIYKEIEKNKKDKEEEMKALAIDERGHSIQEELESKLYTNKYLRHMTEGLILGSGIYWPDDEKLMSMLIRAGQNPQI